MSSTWARLRHAALGLTIAAAAVTAVPVVSARPQAPATGRAAERIAANSAEKFCWAVSFSPASAYDLLDARARARMPPAAFVALLSRTFPDGPPGRLEATHAASAGPGVLDIFLSGDRGSVRVRMTGSAARGYRVLDVERSTGPTSSARPVLPDTGPFQRYYPMAADSQIAFVPISADASVVSTLADTFAARLRLDTKLQPVYTPSAAARNQARGQLIGEVLAKELQPRCRRGMTGTPFVIGVTGEDMYLQTYPQWRFAFSYRLAPCVAVVSYFRMQIAASSDVQAARLRKMVAKNLGVLVYGLETTKDPRSLMFDQILGIDDLDFIDDNFDRAGMAPSERR